ncbi:hypothetical protein B0T18DRAFT_385443 [Schizothecium vesticola]|uniref:Uncharacterized protein n=1 Tax=Schizothecium vesticola TaxID=314040 RepID=A0AA40KBQ7_9PEZI|nr:hypothetical protein B0T18DRAFT_385443 [Schizothecium vesticola]
MGVHAVPRCEGKSKKKAARGDFYAYSYGLWGAWWASVSSPSAIRHPPSSRQAERLTESQSDQQLQQPGCGLEGRNLIEIGPREAPAQTSMTSASAGVEASEDDALMLRQTPAGRCLSETRLPHVKDAIGASATVASHDDHPRGHRQGRRHRIAAGAAWLQMFATGARSHIKSS